MTRDEVQQALIELNQTIAQLELRLHPPPLNPGDRADLQAELVAAENARDALQQILNDLPVR
jgi:hypothetical protein